MTCPPRNGVGGPKTKLITETSQSLSAGNGEKGLNVGVTIVRNRFLGGRSLSERGLQ
jgi:hypothetical protein